MDVDISDTRSTSSSDVPPYKKSKISEPNMFDMNDFDSFNHFDDTPKGRALNIMHQLRDDPDKFEDLLTQMSDIFDNINNSILKLVAQNPGPSFAQVCSIPKITSVTKTTSQNNSKKVNLYVKSESENDQVAKDSKAIFKELNEKIKPHQEKISVSNMKIVKNNLIKITTESKQDADRLKNVIKQRIPLVKVESEKKFDPRIIVFGVDENTDNRTLLEQIYYHNALVNSSTTWDTFTKNCKVIKRTKATNLKLQNVILEIHPMLRTQFFIEGKQKIRINWKTLNWNDSYFVLRCSKCLRTGHHHTKCQHVQTCSKCGKEHNSEVCPEFKSPRCHLCSLFSKHPQQIQHNLADKDCSVHINALKRISQRVNYDESTPFKTMPDQHE